MQTFSTDISDTLQLQGQCFLPGIGLLHIVRSPAEKSYQKNQLTPPSYEIVLDPSVRSAGAAPSIERRMADAHSMTSEEAHEAWKQAADQIREKLSTGSSVELEGLGLLNIGEEGTIAFVGTHIPSPVYDPISLESIKRLTGKTSASGQAGTSLPQAQPAMEAAAAAGNEDAFGALASSRQPKPRWWIIGSIVVLLLVGWFTYRGTMQRRKHATHIARIMHKANTADSKDLPRADSLALLSDTLVRTAVSDSVRYFIVIAEYKDENRALRQYKKMRGWGHPVELRTLDSLTYKLAFPVTSLPADTTVQLVNMMKIYGEKTHIEYDLTP